MIREFEEYPEKNISNMIVNENYFLQMVWIMTVIFPNYYVIEAYMC